MINGKHVPKWGLINWPNMPQNLSAQFVCPSQKVLDFNEKRLHWASVVCALYHYSNFGWDKISFKHPLLCNKTLIALKPFPQFNKVFSNGFFIWLLGIAISSKLVFELQDLSYGFCSFHELIFGPIYLSHQLELIL